MFKDAEITSRYVKEDTGQIIQILAELAKDKELWLAIRDIIVEYLKTEQAYVDLAKELAKVDVEFMQKALLTYPELLEIAEKALRVHSIFRPIGVRERAENARSMALQEIDRFTAKHEELQEKRIINLMEIQKERLEGMAPLLEKLKALVNTRLAKYQIPQLLSKDGDSE